MTKHLRTNKQFMIGNGLLAFGVIIIVSLFIYLSFRSPKKQEGPISYPEIYTLSFSKGFTDDSISVFLNDSLLMERKITKEPYLFSFNRFERQNTLLIVDHKTDNLSAFELDNKGGTYQFIKEGNQINIVEE
ncbi:MAG: hypothetical protein GX963_00780 [Bacteroidales bacterium]|nr:hypothetical protein [Bacteroidales bacterium]